jgi:hypothetical protein
MTIGLKACSLHLFPSETLHFSLRVLIILPNNISDISQMRPVRLLTLNLLLFVTTRFTLSAVSGSTRIGFFVIKTNTQHLRSMFASFQRVDVCSRSIA